jgi:TPR repeat protein
LTLGKAYYIATDIGGNCKKALHWFSLAADQRNMEAQFRLADMYALGKGTEKNEFLAYDGYLKSAIQGYPKALTRLQNLYHVEKSIHCRGQMTCEEEKWTDPEFKKENNIRELFEYREQMLKSTLTNIEQYFEELIKDCRKKDTPEAYLTLGFLYQHGYGARKIRAQAIENYSLASIKGNIDAQYNLGYIYHHDTDIKYNYRESIQYYTQAAKKGHIYAQSGLAYLYLKGLRVDMDYSKAHFWYSKAAKNRNIEAQIALAHMFRIGQGVAQDITEAIKWYCSAAKEGSTVAQNCLDSLCAGDGSNNAEETPNNNDKPPNVFTKKGLTSKLKTDVSTIKHSADTKNLEKLATRALFGDGPSMFSIGVKYYDGNDFNQTKTLRSNGC